MFTKNHNLENVSIVRYYPVTHELLFTAPLVLLTGDARGEDFFMKIF